MKRFLPKKPISAFFAWVTLNLYSAILFTLAALKEISSRDFPDHDPFVSAPIDPVKDLFVHVIDLSIIFFGLATGICIYVMAILLDRLNTKFIRSIICGIGITVTSLVFWRGILLINMGAECLYFSLLPGGGSPFGCWPTVEPKQWHLIIGFLGTLGIVTLWALWQKRLTPKTRNTTANIA